MIAKSPHLNLSYALDINSVKIQIIFALHIKVIFSVEQYGNRFDVNQRVASA